MNAQADSIREAIRRGEYTQALAEWNGYAGQLCDAIRAGVLPHGQMEEARALVEWSRGTLLGARAHLRARLHALEVAAAYERRAGSPARRALVDARG